MIANMCSSKTEGMLIGVAFQLRRPLEKIERVCTFHLQDMLPLYIEK